MKLIFKSIIFIISVSVIIMAAGYYATEQSRKPVYGDITFSVNIPLANYSGFSNVTFFLNATWTGTVQFNFTNESGTSGFTIIYLGSNQSSLQKNISLSNTNYHGSVYNPYIKQPRFPVFPIYYYLPFHLSTSHPHDKIVWILDNGPQKVPRGYYAYYLFSEFGNTEFSNQSLELNREYIYI